MSFCGYQEKKGEIYLGYGIHDIGIKIDGNPYKVSFIIEDPVDSCCVCHGGSNKIDLHIHEKGFKLHADIKTNTAYIEWKCVYKV